MYNNHHSRFVTALDLTIRQLHCNDPGFVDQIYPGGGERRDKSAYHVAQFGAAVSLVSPFFPHHQENPFRTELTPLKRLESDPCITISTVSAAAH